MISKILKLTLFLALISGLAGAQVKIASYNLLGYPGTDTTTRNPYFRTVVTAMSPDILVIQEITSQAGINGFLNGVMNYNGSNYGTGTFIDGPDTDNGIFFKTAIYAFISNTPIHTALRDINEFKLVHLPDHDTLRIYSVHLKASTGSANELSRGAEVDSLRKVTNALPANAHFIVCCDFNIYKSTEPAYQKLLEITAGNGNFNDPLTLVGTWNTSGYSIYHTQSTRTRSFGGGATGGLDDRFDMILYSTAIKNGTGLTYVANSMTPYGNDGNHYNDSINKPPNSAVTQSVANALHYASDHLPVYALFSYPAVGVGLINSQVPSMFTMYQNYPNPFNNSCVIKFDLPHSTFVNLRIYNSLWQVIETLVNNNLSAGSYSVQWDAVDSPSGVYFYQANLDGVVYTKRMLLVK